MARQRKSGKTKAERVAEAVEEAVNAGKQWELETVDFDDPDRSPTCIEVDFPIIPINQIAAIEGNAGKPIYQMSKWWARRRSSVFRSMLIAAATKAPEDPSEAAKVVWDAYYGNHQAKGAFKHLKVADIFMGGGTTVVEGSRLGMQMYGNDLNPVAWFVTKNELADVDRTEVESLLSEIETEVKPQIMPFYSCDCPRGHKGKWTRKSDGEVMGDGFDPLQLMPEERKGYVYEGPEVVYTFWAKHGPCQVTGCGHRTPIMTSPVVAVKTFTVKSWTRKCATCQCTYDLEEHDTRMAPGAALIVAETERPFAIAKLNQWNGEPESAICPCCGKTESVGSLGKPKKKKVELSLLVHPGWLKGEAAADQEGRPYGGSADDDVESTVRWNNARAAKTRLLEIRGKLPEVVVDPTTGTRVVPDSSGGTRTGRGKYVCSSCGNSSSFTSSVGAFGKTAPIAAYAIQGFCPACKEEKQPYGGRFFAALSDATRLNSAIGEWMTRKDTDLAEFWPKSEIAFGHETHQRQPLPQRGYSHWWKMFNQRQLLVHALLLRRISAQVRDNQTLGEFVLGAFQQYLRNQNMFNIWNPQRDTPEPMFSNNNYHPKSTAVENNVFCSFGRGNWYSQRSTLVEAIEWRKDPWEVVSNERLASVSSELGNAVSGKSERTRTNDALKDTILIACQSASEKLTCGTSTELRTLQDRSYDLVITDPPFGDNLQYSELANFFYVWLKLPLGEVYPEYFGSDYSPMALEAVANRARQEEPDRFFQRILLECWKEASRVLKPAGLLAFTFHHSEDAPWVSVLESLFDAGFYLIATYPIRGDESKGEGAFGSQKIEYDIIHVCRKRTEDPKAISWAKLRRQVLQDIRGLKDLLEHHSNEGLPEADLQVIRRGKALEYFSRHYGKVYKDEGAPMSVLEGLLGINQLIDEETGGVKEAPPHNAEPFTRMLLRLFDGVDTLPRDQIQKFLRGTGSAPSDFVERGWLYEEKKIFYLTSPLEIARSWIGKRRKGLQSDYDQAMFFIGACFEGSGINANETFNNENFKPHPALGAILSWFKTHGADSQVRNGAVISAQLYQNWEKRNQKKANQLTLFDMMGEEDE